MKITEKFSRGEFVVTAEVGPPKGFHIENMIEEAKTYLSGITAVNVTDNQSSVMRLSSLATCKALKDAGLDPIFQMTCRDRNRMALESDILSAARVTKVAGEDIVSVQDFASCHIAHKTTCTSRIIVGGQCTASRTIKITVLDRTSIHDCDDTTYITTALNT